jgi:hypothetical protein
MYWFLAGKASQRGKPKPRNTKMRDLNRKGAEKEGGTDMDAFTEPSPEETVPLMPSSLSPGSQPLAPATPNKVTDNQVVKVSARIWIYLALYRRSQFLNVCPRCSKYMDRVLCLLRSPPHRCLCHPSCLW